MEASVEAAEVLVSPQPDVATSSVDANNADGEVAAPAPPPAASDSSSSSDPMEEFSRRLEDIISTYGSAADALDKQVEAEKTRKEANDGIAASMEAEVSVVMQSLNQLSSPEDKLGHLLRKYAELAVSRRSDERTLCVLQDETRSSIAARSKLEILCRELQGHYSLLREETLRHCREDEEKRTEMVDHFQTKLAEIQTQIEQHNARNDKLCRENANLTDKLESLMNQCELREESLEKIDQRRDLQQKLTEAKLQQANALLSEAEDKHKREKEYLLVQAAEWKLQAQTLREQAAVMQAQLTLYGQKFDDFQATLAKSNQIYARFKKEMDNMSEKMKKMEKESNLWKARFENCNKALTDMIEERTEKGKEYDLFVLKIQKLEKLCRALQDERIVLYDKIKEVRHANSNLPSKVFGIANTEGSDKSSLETPLTPLELQEMEEDDPVLTENMSRLTEEQAKLQEFAASLLATPSDDEEEDKHEVDLEEDTVASAFVHFKTKTPVKKEAVSVPEQVVEVTSQTSESGLPQPDKAEEVPEPAMAPPEPPTPVESTSETEAKTETVAVQAQAEDKEVQPEPDVKPDEEIQQQTAESVPTSEPQKVEINPPTDLKPEAAEAEVLIQAGEVKPVIPMEEKKVQAEPEEAPTNSTESTLPAENSPKMTASSSSNCSKKQTPKKKKKKNTKSAS